MTALWGSTAFDIGPETQYALCGIASLGRFLDLEMNWSCLYLLSGLKWMMLIACWH